MKNSEVITKWYEEVWNKKNEDAINELYASDCIAHGLADDAGNEIVGPEMFKVFFRKFIGSFPHIRVTVDDMVSEGDKIAARATVRLSHTGENFLLSAEKSLAPSGKIIEFSGMTFTTIRNGQIAEAWNNFDFLRLYTELGAFETKQEKAMP